MLRKLHVLVHMTGAKSSQHGAGRASLFELGTSCSGLPMTG